MIAIQLTVSETGQAKGKAQKHQQVQEIQYRLVVDYLQRLQSDLLYKISQSESLLNDKFNQDLDPLDCKTCGLRFSVAHQLYFHLKNSGKCLPTQEQSSYLPEIQQNDPAEIEKAFTLSEDHIEYRTCNICGKIFDKAISMVRHVYAHHAGIYSYECKVCGKKLRTKFLFHRHLRTCNKKPESSQNRKCTICKRKTIIPTVCGFEKILVEICEHTNYEDFILAAITDLSISADMRNISLSVAGCKLKAPQFKDVVLQYSSSPSFSIEVLIEDRSLSPSTLSLTERANSSEEVEEVEEEMDWDLDKAPILIKGQLVLPLPNADSIKSIKSIGMIVNNFENGKKLENKDRTKISKAIIDECLQNHPGRLLKREDFLALANSIVEAFPTEISSCYYIPAVEGNPARGKLWCAYNNKRTALSAEGEIIRQHWKRRLSKSPTSMSTFCEELMSSQEQQVDTPLLLNGNLILPLPNADCIKSLEILQPVVASFKKNKRLENKHQIKIAKAVIDECLREYPARQLKRRDFLLLTNNIVEAFPTETSAPYYIPALDGKPARGKLWNAYNNKRTALNAEGEISRQTSTKRQSKPPVLVSDSKRECIEYIQSNTGEWSTICEKWKETISERQLELKSNITIFEYINKYPGLQGSRALDLLEIDVSKRYPNASSVDTWFTFYKKVVMKARTSSDKVASAYLKEIDSSNDERYKAGLALTLIAYLLPHSGKNATKNQIQESFIKEYQSLDELEKAEMQIRFVKDQGKVIYADFIIAGFIYNCDDLLDALNIGFKFIMALDVKYPKLCNHVWQFVQLGIFKIDLPISKVSVIETLLNDLLSN